MSKKLLICVIFIILLSSLVCLPKSHAIDAIFAEGKGFLEAGDFYRNQIDGNELKRTSNYIYNILFGVATMIAVIVAMILGIQFMVASADEKAKVKEAVLPFVVGCFVVFGSFTIWKIVVNIGNKAEDRIDSPVKYIKTEDRLYCGYCADELSESEQKDGKCSSCGKFIEEI